MLLKLARASIVVMAAGLAIVAAPGSSVPDAYGFAEFETIVFEGPSQPFHGGPPPHVATDEDDSFHLDMGGVHWENLPLTVEYAINTAGCSEDCAGAVAAINAGFDAWEQSGITFTEDQSAELNDCGVQNSVTFAAIDGPGGTLAGTSVCMNFATKEIVGFRIVFDSGDTWSDSGDAEKIDIQAVAAHEAGHAVGPGHVRAPAASAMTMYFAIADGDIGPRTLGCGDRLALNALYSAGLDCSVLPGD